MTTYCLGDENSFTLRSSRVLWNASYIPPEMLDRNQVISRTTDAILKDSESPANRNSLEFQRNLKWLQKMGEVSPEIQRNDRLQILFAEHGAGRPFSR